MTRSSASLRSKSSFENQFNPTFTHKNIAKLAMKVQRQALENMVART